MLTMAYVHRFLTSFAFSIITETVILFVLARFVLKRRDLSAKKIIAAGAIATFMTIPYVWFVIPHLLEWPKSEALIYAEIFAITIEAVFYKYFLRLGWLQAFGISTMCNMASYLLGPVLRFYGLWIYW